MHDFVAALIGGVMIGLAAVLLMLSHGRILGVSGIVSRLLPPVESDWGWRIAFIGGVVCAPIIYTLFSGQQVMIEVTESRVLLIIAGLLVGVGTTLGGGCTSGHGVCGLPRLSIRSIVATCVFMVAGGITVFVLRHIV